MTQSITQQGATVQRGDVVLVDLSGASGGEKMGDHPCVVVQNDKGNAASPLTIVVPLTDARQFKKLPVQVEVAAAELGAGGKDSVAECGHVRTIDKSRIIRHLTKLGAPMMKKIDAALKVSLSLP